MYVVNGIEAVELLETADPAAAQAAQRRGHHPVVERAASDPYTINGIQGVIFSDETGGPGSTIRLDDAEYADALAARQRGQRPIVVVDESGAVVASGPRIQLSGARTLAEDAAAGATVGTLSVSNGSGTYTFSLTDSAGNRFAVDGNDLERGATALNYEAATSHAVTVQADNGVDAPFTRAFTIAVTNVLEAATLAALTLSASTVQEGTTSGTTIGAIQNKAGGSSIALTDDAGGRFAISGTNLVTGLVATDYEAGTSHNITIRETLADSPNSPRDTTLAVTVTDVTFTLAALTLSANTVDSDATAGTVIGAIQNLTSGSSISLTDDDGGQFAISGTNIVVGASALVAGAQSITIRETRAEATNTPRDTVLAITVTSEEWFESDSYDPLVAVMDFNNDRYALPTVGSEIAINGGFGADTDWTKSADTAITGGQLVKSGTSSGIIATTAANLATVVGTVYQITFDVVALAGGTITPSFQTGTIVNGTVVSTTGTHTRYLMAAVTNHTFRLALSATSATATIDNVSIKEVILTPTGRTYGSEVVTNGTFATAPTLGSELLTNTDFATDRTGWTDSTTGVGSAAQGSGKLQVTRTTGSFSVYQEVSLTTGVTYQFSAKVRVVSGPGGSSGTLGVRTTTGASGGAFGGSLAMSTIATSEITITNQFTSTATGTARVHIGSYGADGSVTEWDDISFKEVTNFASVGWLLQTNVSSATATVPTQTISGGTLNLTGDGTNAAYADQSFTTVNGQVYEFVFTQNAQQLGVSVGTTQGGTNIINSLNTGGTAATHTFKFTAQSTTTWVRFAKAPAALLTIDNVSIKALTAIGTYPKRSATFDECFAYTAASDVARTYVNSGGTLVNDLAVNARRMTYVNAKRQLRLENAGTNLCTYSEDQSNAAWAKTNATIGSVHTAGPLGRTITARPVVEDTTSGAHQISMASVSVTSGVAYTFSAYFKKGTRDWISITGSSGPFGGTNTTYFNLNTGVVGTVGSSVTATITAVGGGWHRCAWTRTAGSSTTSSIFIAATTADNTVSNYAGVAAAEAFYIDAAQLEASAFPTDYIPTTSASVTRAIETCRLSPLLEAVLQRAQGSMVARADTSYTALAGNKNLLGGDTTTMPLFINGGVTTQASTFSSISLHATVGSGSTLDPLGAAMGFDAAGRAVVGNGGTVATDANPMGSRVTIYLGRSATINATAPYGDGHYDLFAVSPERLPNTNLQALAVAAP